jgi:hypothetical protein
MAKGRIGSHAALVSLLLLLLAPLPARSQEGQPPPAAPQVPAAVSDTSLAPPTGLTVEDTPNDRGGSLTLHWTLSASDTEEEAESGSRPGSHKASAPFSGYDIFRSTSPEGPFALIDSTTARFTEYADGGNVVDGVPYYYKVAALRDGESAESAVAGPGIARAQWFHRGRLNTLVAVLILSALIIYFIEHARKGGAIFIRKIAGLEAVDEAVGRATEMGRKILYVPGTQDMDNVQTLAGIAILGRVARLTAQYETPMEVPVSRSLVMVACRETVKESYMSEGRPDGYSDSMIYYLTDDQFGYAAALDGIMVREKPATIFMQGAFYAESLILAETGNSIGAIQLPFFVAACDYTLIGEELFVAGAYLSREPRQLGSLKGQDLGKAIILGLLLIGTMVQTLHIFDFSSLFKVQ